MAIPATSAKLFTTSGAPVPAFTTGGVRVFGSGQEQTPIEEMTQRRHLTTGNASWRHSDTAGEVTTYVWEHPVIIDGTQIEVAWPHRGAPAEATITFRSFLRHRGTSYPLTVDGDPLIVQPRDTYVAADIVPITVRAGDTITIAREYQVGSTVPIGSMGWDRATGGRYPGPYDPRKTGEALTAISGSASVISGLTKPGVGLSLGIVGDSFLEAGWGRLGADAAGVAWTDQSTWLEPTRTTRAQIGQRLPPTGPWPVDVVFTGWGGNDSSSSLYEQQRVHIDSWRMLASTGAKVATTTLHPYTDSVDGFTTVEGQSFKTITANSDGETTREPSRTARNDWLRDGAPLDTTTWEPLPTGSPSATRIGGTGHPISYPVFDQADATETARNSGIWRVDGGAWTGDGTHLRPHGSDMVQPAFEAWLREHVI